MTRTTKRREPLRRDPSRVADKRSEDARIVSVCCVWQPDAMGRARGRTVRQRLIRFGFSRGDSSIPHKTGWSFGVSARKNSLACPEDGGKKRKHQSNTKLAAHDPKILTRLKSFKTSRIGRRLVQRRFALLSNVRTHRKGSRASIRSSHPIIRSIVPRGLCCDSARRGGAARLVCNAQPVLRRKSEFSKAH